MKFLNLTNFFRVSILATVIILSAGPLSALPNDNTRTTTNTVDRDNYNVRTDKDNDNWGWIGLLGLIGLAGLIPKNRTIDHRDRDDTNRTSNR